MKKRGIALISVLIVSAAVVAILAVGLKITNNGVLRVSRVHQRNLALSAAEAAVFEAMAALEVDKTFSGDVEGELEASGASYKYSVDNQLWAGGSAVVVATGQVGQVTRTLRVSLEPDTEGFDALSMDGRMLAHNQAYVNGLTSPQDPRARPGNVHSGFNGGVEDAIYGTGDSHLRASGDVTTAGSIDSVDLQTTSRSQQDGLTKPGYRIDKNTLLDKTFTPTGASDAGVYDGNHRFSGDVTFPTKVTITEGSTIHIQGGSANFLGGVEGEGSLVVDGDVIIQADGEYKSENQKGVTLVADGIVTIKHPEAEVSGDTVSYDVDQVGDYFAKMPDAALTEIAKNPPESAPRDGDFFQWYADNATGGDADFELWYDGNGTEQHPGLSDSTKQWLEDSGPIKEDIKAWVDSATE